MIRSVFSSSVPNHRFWPLKCFLYELMIQMIHSTSVALNIFTFKKMSLSVSNLFLSDLRTSINLLVLSTAFTSTKPTFSRSYLKKKEKKCYKSFEKGFSYNFKILIFVFQILTCSDNSLDILNLSLHALAGIISNQMSLLI